MSICGADESNDTIHSVSFTECDLDVKALATDLEDLQMVTSSLKILSKPISRGRTNLAQPMHVPGGGLGLSVVGNLSGLSFLEQQKCVHKKLCRKVCMLLVCMWRKMLWAATYN